MKRHSSSKKKKTNFIEERSGQETQTPRVKKSLSVTNTNYLQLQIDTSSKKRECLEKTLQNKDRRIRQLESQHQEQQDTLIEFTSKYKQMKTKYDHERNKNQRLQQELRAAVDLCKAMNDKCKEVMERNQALQSNEELLKQRLKEQQIKCKEIKELRKKQKKQMRELMGPFLEALDNQRRGGSGFGFGERT